MSARSRANPWWGPRRTHVLREPFPPGTHTFPDGTYMHIGEPEYVGALPVRTELSVLPADPPGQKPLGWTVSVVNGTEVFKVGAPDVPLTKFEDIQPGDRLIVSTLVGVLEMVAYKDEYGELYADSNPKEEGRGTIANLEFGEDDRRCWVSTCAFNKRGIQKVMAG